MRITDQQRLQWGEIVRERLKALAGLHGIVAERIAKQEAVDARLREALDRVGRDSSDENDALSALETASAEAAKKLRLVGLRLEEAHLEGRVPDEPYRAAMAAAFPQGTGIVGGNPGDRYAAARRIAATLAEHTAVDPEGKLAALAAEAASELETRNTAAKKEAAERQDAHEALGHARVAWDEGYLATKEIVSGLLRDAGRHAELRGVFPDL